MIGTEKELIQGMSSFSVIQQGSCITKAYNRVGVESVLSLSMYIVYK